MLTTRRRYALINNETWSLLMTIKTNYYEDDVLSKDASNIQAMYINFPINKLVGVNSEYVIAVDKPDGLLDYQDYLFYIIPRSAISTSNLDSVCIKFKTAPANTTTHSYIISSGEGFYFSMVTSTYLTTASTSSSRTCYYINDAEAIPFNGFTITSYLYSGTGGGSTGSCINGEEHNYEYVMGGHEAVPVTGDCKNCDNKDLVSYRGACTKCGESATIFYCNKCGTFF